MKFLLPKIGLVIAIVFLFSPQSKACDSPSINGPQKLCLDKTGIYTGTANSEPGCGSMSIEDIDVLSGPGTYEKTENSDRGNDVSIRFNEVGIYTIRYTFRDSDDCGVPACTADVVTEVFLPEASFVESSIKICKDDFLEADISFTNADNATVSSTNIGRNVTGESGGIGTFVSDFPIQESFVLQITKVEESLLNCSQSRVFDSLEVIVLDKPEVELVGINCNNTNTEYSAIYRITGGDGTYTLVSTEEGSIEGNMLTTNFRPSGEAVTVTINSGPTCGDFTITEQEICECTANAGIMQDDPVITCASNTIEVLHDMTDLDKRPSDSIIYVLHNSNQNGIGVDFKISYEPVFDLPNEELADSQLYISAVVGPFTLENFNIDDVDCKDISFGTPVQWISDDDFDIVGELEVCSNEMNRMYSLQVNEPLKTPSSQSWETSVGSGAVIESQNTERIFLSFPSGTATSTLYYHTDFLASDTVTCRTTDSIEITVDPSVSAPDLSDIILWPGDIFASTSDGPCYQWGYVNKFGDFTFNLIEGANSKYYYSDESVSQSILEERGYFVAVYDTPNCEFNLSNCNSFIFYNRNLLPGLQLGEIDDFTLDIAPNPNDGNFRLELKGSYKGIYNIDVVSDIGQRVANLKIDKQYNRSITDMNLENLAKGLYFIIISNEFGKKEIRKTIIAR